MAHYTADKVELVKRFGFGNARDMAEKIIDDLNYYEDGVDLYDMVVDSFNTICIYNKDLWDIIALYESPNHPSIDTEFCYDSYLLNILGCVEKEEV